MKIETVLLSGAGNTFHVVGGEQEVTQKVNMSRLTINICKVNPADGVIFLKKKVNSLNEFEWSFFNNDGSQAEMCGNATRCVGFFLKNVLLDSSAEWVLETVAGKIHILSLKENLFQIQMTPIIQLNSRHGFFCNTGVPHLVLPIENYDEYKTLKEQVCRLRNHFDFLPKGTNVTYIQLFKEKHKIKAVSYERGVENFTEACSTGAMAAAFYNLRTKNCTKTNVEMPGGTLMMDISDVEKPQMIGSAELIGKFIYEF